MDEEINTAPLALIEEARAVLPALRQKVERAGDSVVKRVLLERFSTYPQPKRSDAEWEFWWRDYVEALADQPADAIRAGMREWVRTDLTGFLPKPGQLLALVKAAAEPDWKALSRAYRLSKVEPPKPGIPETLEERQAVAAEVRKLFALKPVPKELDGESDDRGIK